MREVLDRHLASLPPAEVERASYLLQDLKKTGLVEESFTFLDFGAGSGSMSFVILLLCERAKGVLLDVEDRVEMDQEVAKAIEGRYEKLPWDAHQKISGRQFELIVSTDVLEHIPDWKAAFYSTVKYLKPEGYFYIQTPSDYPSPNWPTLGILKNRLKGFFRVNDPALHVRHGLSCKQLLDCATSAGLTPIVAAEDYVINDTVHCAFKPRTHCLFQRTANANGSNL